jgi:hypothetical protein
LLSLKDTNPAAFEEYLRVAKDSLDAREYRTKEEQARQAAMEQQRAQFEQQVTEAVNADALTEISSIRDSIHQNLSAQFTFSTDPAVNELEHFKILSLIGNLQSDYPVYRDMAVKALKAVGVEPNGFAELANRFTERREAYVRLTQQGRQLEARQALSDATIAKQQVLARVNDYALRLAKSSGERAATAASQQSAQLASASARFVPSGNGQSQQGATNPYEQNPHPFGSQEYFAYIRNLDKANKLTGASMFG